MNSATRGWGKALARLGLVLVGLVAAELGWRGVLALRGDGYDAEETALLVRRELESMGAARRAGDVTVPDAEATNNFLHPFIGFETVEGHEATSWQFEVSRRVHREGPLEGDPFVVLVMGGSVARIFASTGENGGAPALAATLEAGVPELAGRVVVLNHGREAHKQPQQATLLAYLFALGLEPDAVVNLDGFNEAGLGMYNAELGLHPVFPSQPIWTQLVTSASPSFFGTPAWEEGILRRIRARRTAARFEEYGLYGSAVLGSIALRWVRGLAVEWRGTVGELSKSIEGRGLTRVSKGPDFLADEEEVLDLVVTNWVASSRATQALCEDRGVPYLHVLQPTLHDEGSKPLTEAEREEGVAPPAIARGVRLGYPLFRASVGELREAGVAVLDASGLFAGIEERVYYDLCHFNRPGTTLLGEAIGEALAELVNGRTAPADAENR